MDQKLQEEEILLQISRGNHKAFREFFMIYYEKLFRFALFYTSNHQTAEDIISDIFLQIWKNRTTVTDIVYLNTYLYRSVYNAIKRHRSRTDNLSPIRNEALLSVEFDGVDPESVTHYNLLRERLEQVVNDLPERCRIIFKLSREDGLPRHEIAQILGITVSTVENQLTIANRRIKQVMSMQVYQF